MMEGSGVQLQWKKLLSEVRRKTLHSGKAKEVSLTEARTEIERDHDRILFSTPVRRLADKTQVFPLEKNDSVRNRLTHSCEVSNLARSVGVALYYNEKIFGSDTSIARNIPAMLAAAGLAHDIGNPPFGHQGEAAIGSWFNTHKVKVFGNKIKRLGPGGVTGRMVQDYVKFEGNAQTLRILSRLQILNDEWGLNLTCGTLGAIMKYPGPSDKTSKAYVARKKFGYFVPEDGVFQDICEETGLDEGIRHPLASIMEACDDIAYSVLDAEDAIKKGIVSFYDLVTFIERQDKDEASVAVVEYAHSKNKEYSNDGLSPAELNDVSAQQFRVKAIHELITSVTKTFASHYEEIMKGDFNHSLLDMGGGAKLSKSLIEFSRKHAFQHRSVLELELRGYNIIHSIMNMLWEAIETRGDPLKLDRHEGTPFQIYAYGRISENYRRIFESKTNKLPLEYKRAQLLADMVSGMTDGFAIDFEKDLRKLKVGYHDGTGS